MKQYLLLLLMLPLMATGQMQKRGISDNTTTGIQWTNGLSWEEIKAKSKKENKFIFLDFFATWCGPCKRMDKETYSDSALGELMNRKFLSVKVQMDRTANDNNDVKQWYAEAQRMGKEYVIKAYPSLVLLSPSGELMSKSTGYRPPRAMFRLASATIDGKKIKDPFEEYNNLLGEYESGIKNYEKMPYIFKMALARDAKSPVAWPVAKEYLKYLGERKENEWYTKANIEFLAAQSLTTRSPFYVMFNENGKKVDKAVGRQGYAQSVLHQIVLLELVGPFLSINVKVERDFNAKVDTTEADWAKLHEMILGQYTDSYADKVVVDAKLIWYWQRKNYPKFNGLIYEALGKYGVDDVIPFSARSFKILNSYFSDVVESVSNPDVLKSAAKWMADVSRLSTGNVNNPMWTDTYAKLLHKTGRLKEAIEVEEGALKIAQDEGYTTWESFIEKTLAKMRNGKPSWWF